MPVLHHVGPVRFRGGRRVLPPSAAPSRNARRALSIHRRALPGPARNARPGLSRLSTPAPDPACHLSAPFGRSRLLHHDRQRHLPLRTHTRSRRALGRPRALPDPGDRRFRYAAGDPRLHHAGRGPYCPVRSPVQGPRLQRRLLRPGSLRLRRLRPRDAETPPRYAPANAPVVEGAGVLRQHELHLPEARPNLRAQPLLLPSPRSSGLPAREQDLPLHLHNRQTSSRSVLPAALRPVRPSTTVGRSYPWRVADPVATEAVTHPDHALPFSRT